MAAQAVFGGELAWWSDIHPAAVKVMTHHHPTAPNLGDLRQVSWWDVPRVDLLTAGYPCQPFSNAGRRLGTDDPRHLWPSVARAIGALRPRIVVLENVAAHLGRGFDLVLADLAVLGYDAAWTVVRASDVSAPHRRARLFIVAVTEDTDSTASDQRGESAPGQAESRGARPDAGRRGGAPAADPGSEQVGQQSEPLAGSGGASITGHDHPAVADAEGLGWPEGWPEPAGLVRGSGASVGGHDPAAEWGVYEPAIRRWERATGWPAPAPTVTGQRGGQQLSPWLVEWMMGLPAGYVTAVPGLSRNDMLHVLGNGVVPQCATWAVEELAHRLGLTSNVERAA